MKDLIFTIYRYKIGKIPKQGELFPEEGRKNPKDYATLEDFFESFLPEKGRFLDLWEEAKKSKGKEETVEKDTHKNEILQHKDHIIVVALQANKFKTIHDENWNERKEPNHPSCFVVFDNRPGHHYVAIQQAAMNTDATAEKILQNSFNFSMNQYGLRFEVVLLKRTMEFLEAVDAIREELKYKVQKVTFDFDKNMGEEKKQSKILKALNEWIGRFAESGQITANVSDDELMQSKCVRKDLNLMADLCTRNSHYKLTVNFERLGLFRYGQDVRAQFGLNEKIISFFCGIEIHTETFDFEDGEFNFTVTLPEWLDDVHKLFKNYEEETLSGKQRRRTRRI